MNPQAMMQYLQALGVHPQILQQLMAGMGATASPAVNYEQPAWQINPDQRPLVPRKPAGDTAPKKPKVGPDGTTDPMTGSGMSGLQNMEGGGGMGSFDFSGLF
jgi:hypothetical protein